MRTIKGRFIATCAAAISLIASQPALAQATNPQGQTPAARPATGPQDPWPGMKKLLVFADVQTGYHHDSISHAMAKIEQMGRETGEWVTIFKTDSQLITKERIVGTGERYSGRSVNARNLDYFDAIVFLGSGAGTLTDQQKADLLSFVRDDGKGFVAEHASSVAYFDWPDFLSMIGSFMKSEYPVKNMTINRVDADFPGADAFPAQFEYQDQFPVTTEPFSSKDVNVIFELDADKMTPEDRERRADGDFPIVWYKSYGKGRVFNNGIGHREEVWDDPKFQELMKGSIRWALGLVDEKGQPVAAPAE